MAIAAFTLLVAAGFGLAGAWLVFPFAGLELMALGYAFYFIGRHAEDYESIRIVDDKLMISHRSLNSVREVVFQRYWAQIVVREMQNGDQRVWVRSHGKEVEVGRYMDAQQRLDLAVQLRQHTGAAR